ncbi:16132_t:CDS:2, partial [Entrophospora sp. SA101]
MSESEHQKQSIIILDLNNKIMQLQQQLKNYEHEVSELKKNLDTSYNHIDEIQNLYEEQFSKNKYLLEQWDSRFSNQQKRIEAIKEITNAEKFINPQETRTIWKSLGDEYELSEQLKDFTNITKKA